MKVFRYHHTNCFFVTGRGGRLLAFDAGWPCTMHEYCRMMKTIGLRYENIAWAIISHMHMDHAGLLGEFQKSGIQCFVLDEQSAGITEMERIITKNAGYASYMRIDPTKLTRVTLEQLQEICAEIEVYGRVLKTPGHSVDSITYVTKDHEALIGDLSPKNQVAPDDSTSLASWALVTAHGAKTIFPSHAEPFAL